MKILFLDDNSYRTNLFLDAVVKDSDDKVRTTSTARDCIDLISKDDWDFVFLDHDLGGEVYVNSDREDCGMEVVRYLQENKKEINTIFVHTLNKDASNSMVDKLKTAGYNVVSSPFIYIEWDYLYSELKKIINDKQK